MDEIERASFCYFWEETNPDTGRVGFVDAFNPNTGWVDEWVLGLYAGITLLIAENSRTGFVWKTF